MLRRWFGDRSVILSRLSLGVWLALIVAGSLIPNRVIADASGPAGELFFRVASKVAHVVAYAVLCLLLIWAAAPLRWPARVIGAAAGAILIGVLMEILQPLTGRSCSAADAAFDALGVCAVLLGIALRRRFRAQRR